MSMPATNSGSCVPAPTRVSSAAPVPAVASNAYSNNSGNTGKCNKSSDGRNHGRGRNRHHRGASSYVPSIPEQLPKDCRTPERYITINMEYFGYIAIFFLDIKNLTIMKDRDVGMDEFAIELALWFEEMWTGEIRSCGKGCTLMENPCAAALKFGCAWILASIKGVTHRLEDKRCVNLFITHAITDFHILQQRLDPSVADCYQWCYSKLKFAECCAKDLWCFVDSAGCCRRLLPYLFLGFSWLPSYHFLGLTGCCPTSLMGLADCCNMLFFAPTTVSSAALTFAPTTVSSAAFSFAPTTVSSAAVTFAPTTVSSAAFSFAPTTVSSAAVTFAPTTVSSAAFSFAPTTVSSAAFSFAPTTVSSAAFSFAPTTVSSAALTFAPTTVSSAALTFAPTTVSSAAFSFALTTVSSAAAAAPTPDALTANGASNNGNGGSSRHRGHALQQCVETNMAHSGAQDDFLDFDCASAFAVNLSHAGNQGAYMEQDDVLSLGADMSLEANQEPYQEHQGRTPRAGGSTDSTPLGSQAYDQTCRYKHRVGRDAQPNIPILQLLSTAFQTKAKATNDQVVVFMMMHLPCFGSNAQLYDPHPTNCIDVRIIGTIALKGWNHLFPTKFPTNFQDDVQAVVAEAKFVSLEPNVFPRGVVNENLEHDLFSTTAPDVNAYSVLQAQDDVLDLDYAPAPTANQSSKDNQGASTDQDEVLFRGTDVHSLGEDQGANHDGSCGAKKGNQGAGGTANYLPPADLENDPLGIIQNEVSSQDGSKVSLGLGKGAAKALSQRHPSIESRDGLHNERETDDFLHRDNADQVPAENQGVHVNQDDVLLQGANMEVPADDQGSIQEAHAMENQGVDMAEKQGAIHFVVMRNSFKTPSVCFHKALYGCVKSVLLWYNHLASTLMDMGFELNLYYPCAANKMVNGKQCTVAWYVDDNNISHMDPQVVTNVITALEEHIGEMTVTSGCCHKCLGMDITFNFDGTVSILMEDYLKSVIEFLGEPISSSNATDKGLLDVNPDPPAVDSKERIDLYGSIVPKGRASAGQKSLHINIHHYFITNHVKTEGLNIIYCPAEAVLAVSFTKLLKGALFRKFRDVILAPSSFSVPATSLREERVGKNDKTPTLTENAEKHSEAANHAEKRLIPGEPGRRTYADVLRGCEDLKTDVPHGCGIADRNNENVHRGCKSIADGVVCTNKIGDGVVSAKVRKKRNDKKGTEETVTFLE
ncbi:reverse transcriptase RNA-dependent DNA polymerase [Nitzschia inconspicua]|uniref:Reverse transcriptase RNA-dependent DNA polymerase n=2 Tax=Nitzschia inconspicua TaxID=303405 RepID=A0A9K3L6I8_9STRA|nr:reverse transcriptase RNA-dependent DNA polymerase [Nitzschia inconspicua]